ncbi:MAG: transporter substrate-binding domain-containing protein [Paludibacter sp.]|nr:transporter substrate-binding domain-containing protein [Paludibacter sp.]
MKKSSFIVILSILTLTLFNGCKEDNLEDLTITISTINSKPNSFEKDGKIVGIDADIAAQAMKSAGIKFEMSMSDSWETAFNTTLNGSKKALLTTTYTPERKDQFKWAGPTSQGMYGIFENGDSGYTFPMPLDECKKIQAIAVIKDWTETTMLENLGFENLVHYDTFEEAIAAFMAKEQKFIACDFFQLVSSLPSGYYMENVMAITRYHTAYYYIAFSKDVSDAAVEKIQNAIESLIKDQTTGAILQQYFPTMPTDYIPGTIQLYCEASPPFSFMTGVDVNRKVEGSGTDIVNAIQTRTGHVNKINMSIWTDAYAVVQYLPNSALFNTTRTPERENLFQWVGPISTSKAYFYTLTSSGLTIQDLEQAKGLQSIATPKGWFTHDFLIKNNFQNIVATSNTSAEAFEQLVKGEVQALMMTELDLNWLAEMNEIPTGNLTKHFEVLNYKDYIAFSLSTPAKTVQQWQNHLDAMKTDGTFKTLWDKWFLGVPMP